MGCFINSHANAGIPEEPPFPTFLSNGYNQEVHWEGVRMDCGMAMVCVVARWSRPRWCWAGEFRPGCKCGCHVGKTAWEWRVRGIQTYQKPVLIPSCIYSNLYPYSLSGLWYHKLVLSPREVQQRMIELIRLVSKRHLIIDPDLASYT